jgi:hypothetical protein
MLTGESASYLDAGLGTEANVDQDDVRIVLLASAICLSSGRHAADHADSFAIEQFARSAKEVRVVIDDKAAQSHIT